jgi:hypothetical protein
MAKAGTEKPKPKAKPKEPKLTDAERHRRFVDMAHEVEAEESQESFDAAFKRIARANLHVKSDDK